MAGCITKKTTKNSILYLGPFINYLVSKFSKLGVYFQEVCPKIEIEIGHFLTKIENFKVSKFLNNKILFILIIYRHSCQRPPCRIFILLKLSYKRESTQKRRKAKRKNGDFSTQRSLPNATIFTVKPNS